MAKRVITKAGDVIAVPLVDGVFACLVVTFVFKDFKNCIAVGVLSELLPRAELPQHASCSFCIYPLFVGKQLITAGIWPRIGQIELPPPFDSPPEILVAGNVHHGDAPVRIATPSDERKLPTLLAHGGEALKSRLRTHFNVT